MKAIVVVDNISKDNLPGEWGLCIHIEYGEKNILLDTGGSGLFLKNAKSLGIDIRKIDYAILSHAHYDHADGMWKFFEANDTAKFYLRDGCNENCYMKKWFFHKYIGIPKNILDEYQERIVYVKDDYTLFPGASLIPHKTEGLSEIGKKNMMYIRNGRSWIPDDFSHEQSLVFDTSSGLVIFNSCSHGGADNIINEIAKTYPDKRIKALVGGFHIFNKSKAEVKELAARIKMTGIEAVYTGHCTGNRSFGILQEELGDMVQQLHTGLIMEF
jgi:7,8-dihydropterin-6-yl-methyl-4-(beta-D-ribofuranosyl)aminobenzene 5'-phosphate synthase